MNMYMIGVRCTLLAIAIWSAWKRLAYCRTWESLGLFIMTVVGALRLWGGRMVLA